MPFDRVFLGWDQPALQSAVHWLIEHRACKDQLNLARTALVTPGSRAGRRLIELLVDQCQTASLDLVPPRTLTPSSLAESLAGWPHANDPQLATDLQQRLAWSTALQNLPQPQRLALLPQTPDLHDAPAWLRLAGMIQSLWLELTAARLDFAQVASLLAGQISTNELARWQSLASAQLDYAQRLAHAHRIDPQTWRNQADARTPATEFDELILIGVADQSPQIRHLLSHTTSRITLLIAAPAELADRFDPWGCVLPQHWEKATIPIDDARVQVVDQPIDQALTAVRHIESWQGAYGADQITIGSVDPQLTDVLTHWMGAYGLPLRDPLGTPAARSAPMQLLAAISRCLAQQSFGAFAALLRHPDLGAWLARTQPQLAGDSELWLQWADRYQADHLQARLSSDWLGQDDRAQRLKSIFQAVAASLFEPMTRRASLSDFAEPIVQLLRDIYGGQQLNRNIPHDRLIIDSCIKLTDQAVELHQLPPSLSPTLTGEQAMTILLDLLGDMTIPPAQESTAIELLGWLELPLDDAPAMIVTGFNEPHIPQALTADPFLPESLRRLINEQLDDDRFIADNARRLARDAYALSLISRPHRRLEIIAGQRGLDGDPLSPSRLLLADEPSVIARRISQWCGELRAAQPALLPNAYAHAQSPQIHLPPVPVIELDPPIDSLRVTDFKLFLEDPYRFALERGLKLESLDDLAQEMDAMAFGGLAHDVLEAFGKSPLKSCEDADRITQFLADTLSTLALARYGVHPQPAVRLQVRQLQYRLEHFAKWQASRAQQGWRIVDVEIDFGRDQPPGQLIVDDKPMGLRGKIDRIEYNESQQIWAVCDYKTSSNAQSPDATHRRGRGDARQWVDLQLPLYRKLLQSWCDESGQPRIQENAKVELGYLLLPRGNDGAQTWEKAPWDDDLLAEAFEAAAQVVRAVRANRFVFDPSRSVGFDRFADVVGSALLIDDEAGESAEADE